MLLDSLSLSYSGMLRIMLEQAQIPSLHPIDLAISNARVFISY